LCTISRGRNTAYNSVSTKVQGSSRSTTQVSMIESSSMPVDDSCISDPNCTDPNMNPSSNLTFEELKTERFDRDDWSRLTVANIIRYVHWPPNQTLLTKYVEIREDLSVKVYNYMTNTIWYDYLVDYIHDTSS